MIRTICHRCNRNLLAFVSKTTTLSQRSSTPWIATLTSLAPHMHTVSVRRQQLNGSSGKHSPKHRSHMLHDWKSQCPSRMHRLPSVPVGYEPCSPPICITCGDRRGSCPQRINYLEKSQCLRWRQAWKSVGET